jgi:sulfite oxidase
LTANIPNISTEQWTITVKGLVNNACTLSLDELKSQFESKRVVAALQCAGNRRSTMVDATGKEVDGILWVKPLWQTSHGRESRWPIY